MTERRNPRARALATLALTALVTACPAVDEAYAAGSARTLGLGEASIAIPDPILLGRDNPAFLGVARDRGLRISVFDVGAEVGNSAFSTGDYSRWNGAELTEADEDEILAKIDGEWKISGRGLGYAPAFAYGPVALTARGTGRGGGVIPASVLEVVFDGNTTEEVTDFSDAAGEGWAAFEVGAAYGHSLGSVITGGETMVGLRASYLRGLYYAGIMRAEGQLVTQPDTLYGSAALDLLTATGGSGYRIDLGAVHNRGPLNVGLRLEGILGSMRWTGDPERLEFRAEGSSPDLLGDDDEDIGDAVSSSDTTLVADAFSMPMPMRIGTGAAYQMGPWIFAGDLEATVRGRYANEQPLRFSLGSERLLFGERLRPRLGVVVGGTAGPAVSGGLTVALGPWRFDLDMGSYKTINPVDPKGFRFSLGTGFVLG